MFAINIYDEELSYKNLMKACALPGQVGHAVDDRYSIRISVVELNKRLEGLDRAVIHKRKQDMNMIYWVRSAKLFPYELYLLTSRFHATRKPP